MPDYINELSYMHIKFPHNYALMSLSCGRLFFIADIHPFNNNTKAFICKPKIYCFVFANFIGICCEISGDLHVISTVILRDFQRTFLHCCIISQCFILKACTFAYQQHAELRHFTFSTSTQCSQQVIIIIYLHSQSLHAFKMWINLLQNNAQKHFIMENRKNVRTCKAREEMLSTSRKTTTQEVFRFAWFEIL